MSTNQENTASNDVYYGTNQLCPACSNYIQGVIPNALAEIDEKLGILTLVGYEEHANLKDLWLSDPPPNASIGDSWRSCYVQPLVRPEKGIGDTYRAFHAVKSIPANLLSASGMHVVSKNWLPDCLQYHGPCNKRQENENSLCTGTRPTRVIEIQTDKQIVRLVDTTSLPAECFKYLTLSHAWGQNVQFLQLTTENHNSFMERIPVERPDFNPTFQQAIIVTRLLGYKYLWIDSLCIIQDSKEDKNAEIPRMTDIYGRSDLNLSASGFRDGQQGMVVGRRALVPPELELKNGIQARIILDDEHIGRRYWRLDWRGWVLQENMLAPRTLHFTVRGLVWECYEHARTEIWPDGQSAYAWDPQSETLKRKICFSKTSADEAVYLWYDSIVNDYARRGLTCSHDKLRAIEGLANNIIRSMPPSTGPIYLAGHWMNHRFIESLLWKPSQSAKNYGNDQESIAPSWSWASVKGTVRGLERPTIFRRDEKNTLMHPLVTRFGPILSSTTLYMNVAVHSIGDALSDQFLYRKGGPRDPRGNEVVFHTEWCHDLSIALKTTWFNGLSKPPYNEGHSIHEPWGKDDELPWIGIHLDHHQPSLFESIFMPPVDPDGWHPLEIRNDNSIMISLLAMNNDSKHQIMDVCLVHGLLLRRVGSKEGSPVCERVGSLTLQLKWQSHASMDKIIDGLGRRDIYLR
ncbi:hypothetical protein G7054_g14835 [Neopestalotiopsis clavispora]|nr:hypothetical protein G7054_g14835 [Neopestalotiopsis clavispora]